MGLVARYLEENGFATVVLTPIWEFTREIGIPRIAAIQYPFGRITGQVGDREGQRKVLLETFAVLQDTREPGQVTHLSFKWPENPDWKGPFGMLNDDRRERFDTPQYQTDEDRIRAENYDQSALTSCGCIKCASSL